jgi:hypothetical protein
MGIRFGKGVLALGNAPVQNQSRIDQTTTPPTNLAHRLPKSRFLLNTMAKKRPNE